MYAETCSSVARTSPERAAEVSARGIATNKKRILVGTDAVALDALQHVSPSGYWGGIRALWDPMKFDAEVARRTGRTGDPT